MRLFTDEALPDYYFYDINAKLTQDVGSDDKIAISGFFGQDVLDFSGNQGGVVTIGADIGNRMLSGRWTHIFSNSLFSNFVCYYTKYRNRFAGGQTDYNFVIDNSIEDYTLKGNFE